MDPKACLNACDQAIIDGDVHTAREYLSDYYAWRKRGGFQPFEIAGTLLRGDAFADWCARRIADLVRARA